MFLPMLVEQPFSVRNSSGDEIAGDLRYLDEGQARPVIIICHGFTAHKDWGPFPFIGRRFADLGFASITFNFSHNGIDPRRGKFTEFEKFSNNTIAKELEDVKGILDSLADGRLGGPAANPSCVGIVGHSRGGGVAILSASNDPRIGAAAAWSTVATFLRYTDHQRALWEEQGFLPVSIKGSRTRLRFSVEVLRDLEANRERYDLTAAVRRMQVPLLLIHGTEDVSVKVKEPMALYEASDKKRTELILLEHVGHMYGAGHPFTEPNPILDNIIDTTGRWFHTHLQE